jgi:hypothetical protein
MGVKRTIATGFKKIALTHLVLLVMINCVYDDLGPAPRAVTAYPSGAFPFSPPFPPAVTAGVS